MNRHALWLCTALCASTALAQSPPQRRNWFNDPFFQVSTQVPDCPLPAGPFLTESEMRVQSHGRAERGTTCWLAGQCDRHNSYAYDPDIAQAVQAAFRERNPAPQSSLWVTVQRRVVFVEGCVSDPRTGPRLETLLMALPHVERAIAIVYVKSAPKPAAPAAPAASHQAPRGSPENSGAALRSLEKRGKRPPYKQLTDPT